MLPNVKFCGITRPEDAAAGAEAGAAYLGVVLAPSPRQLSVAQAASLVTSTRGTRVPWVGVFTSSDLDTIAAAVRDIGLSVVQLHSRVPGHFIDDVTRETGARVWCVGQVEGSVVDEIDMEAAGRAETLLFDAAREGRSGGLGVSFDWARSQSLIERWRGRVRIGVAGGLTPENVAEAVQVLRPDLVDVSSGVEQSPGIKDHQRMRTFVERAHAAGRNDG